MVRRIIPTVAALLLAAAPCAFAQVETVAQFNPSLLETPESLAIDHDNNKYVSLALTGEIRKIAADGSQSTYAMLPLGAPPLTFCGSFFAGLTGLTFDEHDNLYANLASCDAGSRGIWKIPHDGQPPTRIGALTLQSLPNGIVHHRDFVYAADSVVGAIWRVPDTGGIAEIWASGPELGQLPNGLPGPNGLKLFEGELYVSNPSQSTVVAVRVRPDGTAGEIRTHATGVFCDDFAFDVHGSLYCGTDPFNTVVRIAPDGSVGDHPYRRRRPRRSDRPAVRPQQGRLRSLCDERGVSVLPGSAAAAAEPHAPEAAGPRIPPAIAARPVSLNRSDGPAVGPRSTRTDREIARGVLQCVCE